MCYIFCVLVYLCKSAPGVVPTGLAILFVRFFFLPSHSFEPTLISLHTEKQNDESTVQYSDT